jgi:hypothetical protein
VFQGGYLSVAIFFIMSGYVCSIKPLKLSRAGKADEVRKVIGSSIFRRILRLGFPAMAATTISWTLDRLGAFNLARSLPGFCWLNFFSPPEFPDFFSALRELFRSFVIPYFLKLAYFSFVHGLSMVLHGQLSEIQLREFNGLWPTKFAVQY